MEDNLLPKSEIEKLKKEIELLKGNQSLLKVNQAHDNYDDLKVSMAALSKSISGLIRIFKEASDEMKMDTHDAVLVSEKLDKIVERLDKIETQNEKIAKGIVAIADMIEEIQSKLKTTPIPQRVSVEPRPLPTYNVPPPDDKKKSLFNIKI